MTTDAIDWIAAEIDLPSLRVAAGTIVGRNAAARRLIGDLEDVAGALSTITGAECDADLVALIGAPSGGKASLELGDYDVFAWADGSETAVLLVPRAARAANAERQRWAAADLAAGVAHELSNALGAILGWVQLARRKSSLEPQAERAMSLIEASARAAHETARHMLETARGAVVGARGRVDLTALSREVVELLGPAADDASVTLEQRTEEGLWVEGSRAQLFTVVWNLVQNAIEATPRDGVVRVVGARSEDDVSLTVSDDGPGIPDDERDRVFEPYYTTKASGTGLGLPLVRRAVESLSGNIRVESAPSGGACFVVDLPYAERKRRAPAISRPSLTRTSGVIERGRAEGARILVVEDDRSMRELFATALELAGAQVDTFGSGEEALAGTERYDLALVDLGLGDLRGDAVLSELRRSGRVSVAALVSGSSVPPLLSSDGKPDAWLRKPFELDDLIATVRQLLSRQIAPGAIAKR